MAQQVVHRVVTAAAEAALPGAVTALQFPPGVLDRAEVRVPDGHSGLTGLQIWYNDNQVIPQTLGVFLKGNGQTYSFDTNDFPTGDGWAAIKYNNDIIAHSWYVTFFIDPVEAQGNPQLPPVILLPFADY